LKHIVTHALPIMHGSEQVLESGVAPETIAGKHPRFVARWKRNAVAQKEQASNDFLWRAEKSGKIERNPHASFNEDPSVRALPIEDRIAGKAT